MKIKIWGRAVLSVALVMVTVVAMPGVIQAGNTQSSGADAAFAQLKSMAGHWQATMVDGGEANYNYEVVSDGTAVMERLMPHGPEHTTEMVTMYHLDGGRLMMTHYCSVGNQPRMAADSYAPDAHKLVFNYVDATNLKSADDGHMQHVEMDFADANHVTQTWTFYKNQKIAMTETFRLTRM